MLYLGRQARWWSAAEEMHIEAGRPMNVGALDNRVEQVADGVASESGDIDARRQAGGAPGMDIATNEPCEQVRFSCSGRSQHQAGECGGRSEERRVGQEVVRTCRSRWSP